MANPLGPIANYRCNQFGHLCTDPGQRDAVRAHRAAAQAADRRAGDGDGPTLNLIDCESNDTGTGLLTPVASLVAGIKALKADPDNQIVVGAISPPATPYTVAWLPASGGQNTQPGELWPLIEHSCGALGGDDVNPLATDAPTDGSFGDPGVRIAQWVHAFGANGVVTSICDADYSVSFQSHRRQDQHAPLRDRQRRRGWSRRHHRRRRRSGRPRQRGRHVRSGRRGWLGRRR